MYGIDDWLEAAYDDRESAEPPDDIYESDMDEALCPICEMPEDVCVDPRGSNWCYFLDKER